MLGLFADLPVLFAQNAPAAGDGGGNLLSMFLAFSPVIVLFYLLILRPQQAQEKKRKAMIDALKKNDRVLTQAGIYGTVMSVSDAGDKVVLRVDDDKNLKLEFSKAAVVRVIDPTTEKAADKA
jgi:preprotein translocase subunit YajC